MKKQQFFPTQQQSPKDKRAEQKLKDNNSIRVSEMMHG